MNTTTPADGTYTYSSPLSNAPIVATFERSALVSWTYAGEDQAVTELAAAQLIHQLGYLDGVTFTPATIGKARAHQLHKIMSRLGLCNPDHYGSARRAIGREVFSLATLTEEEAREVWAYLCRTFPEARSVAA